MRHVRSREHHCVTPGMDDATPGTYDALAEALLDQLGADALVIMVGAPGRAGVSFVSSARTAEASREFARRTIVNMRATADNMETWLQKREREEGP